MEIFRDKTAIVTGGASGIGKGLCEELSKHGARVVVADINEEGARSVAAALVAGGGKAAAVKLDFEDRPLDTAIRNDYRG